MKAGKRRGGPWRINEQMSRSRGRVLLVGVLALAPLPGIRASASPGGTPDWVARYDGTASLKDTPMALTVSPDGTRIYIIGRSHDTATLLEWATFAYDAATGTQLWAASYPGSSGASAVAVSLDSKQVYVTGTTRSGVNEAYTTLAYDALTGSELWVSLYDGPGSITFFDRATSLTVDPAGKALYVTGRSVGSSLYDYATLSLDAETGAQIWVARYDSPDHANDYASSVTVNPSGTRVFVSGQSGGRIGGFDYATVAYGAATGRQLWTRRYDGPSHGSDIPSAIAVDSDGSHVYVTGKSMGLGTAGDYATLAYRASDGGILWLRRYDGNQGVDAATAMGVSPDGRKVFVTRRSAVPGLGFGLATIAYEATSGNMSWISRPNISSGGLQAWQPPVSLCIDPIGSHVFVAGTARTGTGADYLTLSYSASTGREAWRAFYNGTDPGHSIDNAWAVGINSDGTTLFVTGQSAGDQTRGDIATIAY